MSEPLHPEGDQAPQQPMLPYRDGSKDRPQRQAQVAQAIGGAILSIAVTLGVVAIWVLANLQLGPPGTMRRPFEWEMPSVVSLVAFGGLAAITLFARQRFGKRAFAIGVLIGIGIAALIEGACFSGVFR